MKNEISFFEFFLFLWSKKIFIFLFSLFFLLLGFIISYYEHKNKNYRGSIIIYAIGDIESIPTNNLKITSAERFCSKNIDENILECAPFNYYLDIENVSHNFFSEFFKNLNSAEIWMKGIKELEFFKESKNQEKKYNEQIFKFLDTEDLLVKRDANSQLILTVRYSDPIKLEKFIDWIINESIKNVNISMNNTLKKIISDLESDILSSENFIENHEKKLKEQNISQQKILEYTIDQKIEILRLDFLKERIKNMYEKSSFKKMQLMPVKYNKSSILIEEIQTYRINYPLIGFIMGLSFSISILIIRKSYFEYLKNRAI